MLVWVQVLFQVEAVAMHMKRRVFQQGVVECPSGKGDATRHHWTKKKAMAHFRVTFVVTY